MIDFIFIGGGISSLYTAYELLKINPKLNIKILEKNNHLGGRTWKDTFSHTKVVVGAGILRAKDELAIKLLDELKVDYSQHVSTRNYILPKLLDIKAIFTNLKSIYNENPDKYEKNTFKQFAVSVIGNNTYNQFRQQSGYTDYDNQNVYDTLYNYGFSDNFANNKIIYLDWTLLINKIKDKLKTFENVKLYTDINIINIDVDEKITVTTSTKIYTSNYIVSGTDITSFNKLFIKLPKKVLQPYKFIKGQPFLLLYAKLSKESVDIMKKYIKGFTVCSSPIHKIIPINPDDGIYLISYCDNKNAIKLKPSLNNKKYLETLLEKTLDTDDKLKILDLHHYYWENGTHYFKPFEYKYSRNEFFTNIRNPVKNVYIVGEMVSQKQGWVNGVLETCIKVINKINI